VPPAGSMGRAAGQGVRGQSPLKLNTFCVVVCLKWLKAAMFMSKGVNRRGLLGDKKKTRGLGDGSPLAGSMGGALLGGLRDEFSQRLNLFS